MNGVYDLQLVDAFYWHAGISPASCRVIRCRHYGAVPGDGMDVNTLMANADTAMYQAKRGGRNGYRFFLPEMSTAAASAG